MKFLLPFLVVIGGMGSSMMIATNSKLGKVLDSPLLAVGIAFLIGGLLTTAAGLILVAFGKGDLLRAPSAPWWAWIGGILSCIAVFIAVSAKSQGSTAIIVAGTLLGQNLMALAIDHFGWFESEKQPINGYKIGGFLLMLLGALLIGKK